MDASVKQSMLAALRQFAVVSRNDSKPFYESLVQVFSSKQDYMKKVADMDKQFDENPEYESLRELFFDLLLINFFNEDVRKLEEDYLDSPEWEAIEEKTLDRGTELLNLMLYLKECEDEDIEPDLGDFLKEFLLVDEDEFQDEYRIYEDVIANQILVDSDLKEVARVASDLPEGSEMKELFYPMIGFFRDQHPDNEEYDEFVKHSNNPEFDSAVYALLISYNQR
ncbi:MAG: hypothetical protein WBJ10_06815 [Daejeonella sp.]|uniref:hypothetical protein n=1 Tax=Daejeonella sp. TaxID=2805397 RepID=UPI003C741407